MSVGVLALWLASCVSLPARGRWAGGSRAILVADGPGARIDCLVWAPYEFWVDGQTSHCGVDVFDFLKIEDEWKVSNSMWAVEPSACGELRPADPKAIRPAD